MQDCLVCIYLFFLTWMMWIYFLALVDMNYLIAINVDNAIEANHRMILHTLLPKLFSLAVFVFNINRKTTNDSLKKELYPHDFFHERKRSSNLFLFSQKRRHGEEVESLTLKNQSVLMVLKLSDLNNINIKNRTRNNVVQIASSKSSSSRPLRVFSIIFPCISKSNKVWWQGLLAVQQSVNQFRVYIKNGSLLRKNKQ